VIVEVEVAARVGVEVPVMISVVIGVLISVASIANVTIGEGVGVLVSLDSGFPVPPNGKLMGGVLVRMGFMVLANSTVGVEGV
jgi:hypothetical protein